VTLAISDEDARWLIPQQQHFNKLSRGQSASRPLFFAVEL